MTGRITCRVRSRTSTPSMAGAGGLDLAAAFAGPAGKMLARALPHQLATPAQLAADISRRQSNHFVPRHGDVPAAPAHPEAAVTLRALHVGVGGPVVTNLVDEAEAQPDRIGKIEFGHRAR